MNRTIRVLMSDVPRLVQDVLKRAAVEEPDIELAQMEAAPASAAHDDAPDALVVGEAWARRKDAVAQVLIRWPRTRILMITTSGAATVLYELQPRKRDLGELSPAELIKAIRASIRSWDVAIGEL